MTAGLAPQDRVIDSPPETVTSALMHELSDSSLQAAFTFALAADNIVRLPKLIGLTGEVSQEKSRRSGPIRLLSDKKSHLP